MQMALRVTYQTVIYLSKFNISDVFDNNKIELGGCFHIQ